MNVNAITTSLSKALSNKKLFTMLIFGLASGLPNALLLGNLQYWLVAEKIDVTTISILSLISLSYAFKFLWSPLVAHMRLPLLERLGKRKSWIFLCQCLLMLTIYALACISPANNKASFGLLAFLAALASATQDIAIDAWRIDAANETASLDILSTLFQFGYRVSALVGGVASLLLASYISWPHVYMVMAGLMGLALINTLLASDTARGHMRGGDSAQQASRPIGAQPKLMAMGLVLLCWGWALYILMAFIARYLTLPKPDKALVGQFILNYGPWILVATIILPCIIAACLLRFGVKSSAEDKQESITYNLLAPLYTSLLLPLQDLIERFGWRIIILLGWVLTYQLCTNLWAPLAGTLYNKYLHYSYDEIAFASKTFGVIMTIIGISLGGFMLVKWGRFATQVTGVVLQIIGTCVYADLSAGSPFMAMVLRVCGIEGLVAHIARGKEMAHLLAAISFENISMGIAGTAFVAFVSRMTNKSFSAVQYALLSSLALLIGSLGRPYVGMMIDDPHYGYTKSLLALALVGFIGLGFVILEKAFHQEKL
jgi:MFS transporter, PAT family, beta-lactamase induction signal transducer AmpG